MTYNCEICDAWIDDDYSPAEFLKFNNIEKTVCEDCFFEQSEDE